MCRKLVFLIAVLGLVSTVWAEDMNPPLWRGVPLSNMSHWTYDEDAPGDPIYPRLDAPDVSYFVSHPESIDLGNFLERAIAEDWIETWWEMGGWVDDSEYYAENFSMQLWASGGGEPEVGPTWMFEHMGRAGVLTNFAAGSWDMYNFDCPYQPGNWVFIQLTWTPMVPGPVDFTYELDYSTWEVYWEEGAWTEKEILASQKGDLPLIDEIALEGDWKHSTFLFTMWPYPQYEEFGLLPDVPIAIDQIVIDTVNAVPEPATIVLLGLGGLLLCRKRQAL